MDNSTYTCEMHPEVQESAPGRCPTCGMELVKAEPAEAPYTKTGDFVAPKFGSATSGGAENEPGPGQKRRG